MPDRPGIRVPGAMRCPALAVLFAAILAIMVAAGPVSASSDQVRESIMAELVEDGYRRITVGKTWLGRLRFVATKPGARREIVVNPATGEILRDFSRFASDGGTEGVYDPEDDEDVDDDDDDEDRDDEDDRDRDNSGPGSENSGRDDDDDETDNSGSGSSNSGSGSDNSGSGSSDDDD